MRRFIDKDYIECGISYTGIAHSVNYLNYLVHKFDMKVTDIAYCEVPVDELNKIAKKEFNCLKLNKLIYPPTLHQCSDITKFPKNFT